MSRSDKRPDCMIGIQQLTDEEKALYLLRRFDDPSGAGRNLISWISEGGLNKMTKEFARQFLISDMTEH